MRNVREPVPSGPGGGSRMVLRLERQAAAGWTHFAGGMLVRAVADADG